jgi:hypothetical protein
MTRRWDSQINPQFPVPTMDAGEAVSATGAGEGDNPPSTEKRTEERNQKILRGVEGNEKSVGELDARPPRAGEGLSRAVGGIATGAGSAAEGTGEGIGKVASGAGSVVKAVGHAAERLASAGEDAGPLRSATAHKNPYTIDSGMSWGRGGQTETTVTRGDPESNPRSAMAGAGIAPADMTQTSPVPEILPGPSGQRLEPDADHSAGTWNMSDIANYRIGG